MEGTPPTDPITTRVATALTRITRAIGAGRDLDRVFETVADEVAGLLPYDRCSVALLDATGQTLRITSVRSTVPLPIDDGERPVPGTAGGWAVTHRRPLIHDVGPDDRFVGDVARRRAGVKQFVVVPILVDDAAVGALGLSCTRAGVYRQEDLWVLETIADHLGVAIAANDLRRDAERRAARAEFLAGIAALFAASSDLRAALRAAAERTSRVLGDLTTVFLLEERTGELRLEQVAHADPATEARARDILGAHPDDVADLLRPAADGETILAPAAATASVPAAARGVLDRLGARSWLAVPLRTGGRIVGVLASARTWSAAPAGGDSGREPPAPLTAEDVAFAADLAAQIAGAVFNARLLAATRRALDESEALHRIGRELTSTVDLERVLGLVTTFARLLLGADYAGAVVEQAGGYAWHGVVGNRSNAHESAGIAPAQGVLGELAAGRGPVVIEGLSDRAGLGPEESPLLAGEGLRSALAVPFVAGDRFFGALLLGYRRPRAFGPDDLRLATALADQAAIVLENARLFDEAQRAIAHRDEFLAIAAHELRTPLTILKGRAQLLDRRLAPVAAPRDVETLAVVRRQVDRLERLVNDLLDASLIDAGRLPYHPEPVDLVALVHRVAEEAVFRGEERPIDVVAAEPALIAVIDPWGIEQVVTNLVGNARRYSAPGTPVGVRVGRQGAEARVEVTDAGMGIAPEDLERIFERYFRAADARGGIGLALSVSRRIVADHGGRLWATSAGPGQGATFVMTLPLTPPAARDGGDGG